MDNAVPALTQLSNVRKYLVPKYMEVANLYDDSWSKYEFEVMEPSNSGGAAAVLSLRLNDPYQSVDYSQSM